MLLPRLVRTVVIWVCRCVLDLRLMIPALAGPRNPRTSEVQREREARSGLSREAVLITSRASLTLPLYLACARIAQTSQLKDQPPEVAQAPTHTQMTTVSRKTQK